MFECNLLQRKPEVSWFVSTGKEEGIISKTGNTVSSLRWQLSTPTLKKFFKSKRAAFYFFKTGEKYKTNPVFSMKSRTKKRIR